MKSTETETSRAPGPLPLIGAHVATAGGLGSVPGRAAALGAEAVQIFDSNPRRWRPRRASPAELAAFTAGMRQHRLPLFLHTVYLINLASPDAELRLRSQRALTEALLLGARTGAAGVVTHVGSRREERWEQAKRYVADTIVGAFRAAAETLFAKAEMGPDTLPRYTQAQDRAATDFSLPPLLLETAAGTGRTMGGTLAELRELLVALTAALPPTTAAPGVCLDTAHLFAAGYPLHECGGAEGLVTELVAQRLLDRVGLVHLNDSKTPFASHRDRHENLGQGEIGYHALAALVRHPALAHVPFILEVPGATGDGPDALNLMLAKTMRAGAPAPPAPPALGERRPAGPG